MSCAGGTTLCGADCVDTDVDPAHCGGCGQACAPGEVCSGGACALSCAGGTTECGGACTNTSFDPQNCGMCGAACAGAPNATATCAGGACGYFCAGSFDDCNGSAADGCETNTSNDLSACGGCGVACAPVANGSAACAGGVCAIGSCNAPYANCDGSTANGCEANVLTNPAHCGQCGNACAPGEACVNGACGGFQFQLTQQIDGMTVTCSSVVNTGTYTQCNDLKAGGLYMPNGITCGPAWSTVNSLYSNTQGFCQSLTGSASFEVYYVCSSTTARATWFNHVWGTFQDNGYTQHVRCNY